MPTVLALAAAAAGCSGLELTSPLHGSIKVPSRDRPSPPPTEAEAEAAEWDRTADAMKALAACREGAEFLDLDPRYCCFERNLPMRFCANGEAAAPDPHGDARTSQATRDPGAATPTLRDTVKAAEGAVSFVPSNGHVCHGHSVTAAERAAGVFNPESGGTIPLKFPMTRSGCERLLDEDIAEARGEAVRVFGAGDDARTELCYWKRCADFAGQEDLAAAVGSDAHLLSIDRARTLRIAAALRADP
ncbi:MAG: hypothetical protein OXH75_28755 [Acidobacteria bacterium]|nr:hypothetical protein [Acidobacteriota bacterium]